MGWRNVFKMVPVDPSTVANLARTVTEIQSRIVAVLTELTARPELSSHLLEGVTLVNTNINLVEHRLGRKIRGWRVSDLQEDARIWRDTTSDADLSLHLPLRCSAPSVSCTLEVY